MRAMPRARVRSRRRPRASAVAAVLLTAVVPTALGAAGAVPVASAAADSVGLPVVRSVLAGDDPCVSVSGKTAKAEPWTLGALGASRARPLSQGDGVTVAVVDTGVAKEAPALSGRVTALGAAGADCVGHGTFAAGLIAATPGDGGGPEGLAPRARILAVRGTDERGATTAGQVAEGIRGAADEGARVIYVAVALDGGKAQLTDAVRYASSKDALVVAPAAPDALARNEEPAPWYWPAAAPGALAVTDYGPDGGRPSNAPPAGGADLAAPGDAVVSIGPKGSGHFIGSGASFAAAHVAGAAAQVRARYPRLKAAEVSRRLTESAYPAAPPRLDPYAALTAVLTDARGAAPEPQRAALPPSPPAAPRTRALVVAGVGGGLVLLVAAGAVVIPRGRARNWRPAGS
ncbi:MULTISPECIES: S8 family serine peptidase [unclassified Streptomyces]|uniref:S8 family serine peptidase n=1 Tax=unclassified Streptomyces TaxID=2593676 RepID=UPI002E120E4E|nr:MULTISPECIES: S8 family serine peptidase [unclassified Streptomyces]WSJ23993.1 S8 family serine peptidase [Streptomyces sp. NBC_01324]